jgi:hypothetical protein
MNRRIALGTLLTCATLALATSCRNSPTAPATTTPPPTIQTPIAAEIQSISITKFPAKAADGSDWDVSLITSARRPDLYVLLTVDGKPADYISNIANDATTGTTYRFTQPYDATSGSLPAKLAYDASHRIYVMDSDFGGGDDRVGWITVNLPHAYGGDNARTLDYTFADSGDRLRVRVQGTWLY